MEVLSMKRKKCYLCGTLFTTRHNTNILCRGCFDLLRQELGDKWYTQDWWKEIVRSGVRERRVENKEKFVFLEYDPASELKTDYSTVYSIILRLYRTYGYGSRVINRILSDTYRIKLSRRTVAKILSKIKESGVVVDEDAKFWRDWHLKLKSLGFVQFPLAGVIEDD
jgi:hypothetical protein